MPEPILRISPSLGKKLARIRELGPERLAKVAQQLESSRGPVLLRKELRQILETELDESEAKLLETHLISLASLGRARDWSAREILSAVSESLEAAGWEDSDLKAWSEVTGPLEELLESQQFSSLEKALTLAYDHANLLASARILTDVRPIFDTQRAKIIGSIVSQTLRLDYQTEAGSRTISIAVDSEDVELLAQACRMALKKADIAKQLMMEGCKIGAVIVGEDDSDGRD